MNTFIHDTTAFPVFKDIKELVYNCEDLYPGIDLWFDKKVCPGLKRNGNRLLTYVVIDSTLAGFVIVKLGDIGKICHMQVLPEFRHGAVGKELLAESFTQLKGSRKIVATAPESRWVEVDRLLIPAGFDVILRANMYRNGEAEAVYLKDLIGE